MKKKVLNKSQAILTFIKEKPVVASAIGIALALLLGVYAFRNVIFVNGPSLQDEIEKVEDILTKLPDRHPFSGVEIEDAIERPQVYGVMIDNSIDAWPQAGIDQASYIIEAPVESGITRLIAFYTDDQEVEKIGPVRSARPYYMDWNQEVDALYVHIGGSPDALDRVVNEDYFNLNQFFNASSFWRSRSRFAPHNVYTSTDLLDKAYEARETSEDVPEREYQSLKFGSHTDEDIELWSDIEIDFSTTAYKVRWEFDPETKTYARYQGNLRHVTEDGVQLMADAIAVAITDIEVIDFIGRRDIRTTGEGNGFVFKDGKVIRATWEKQNVDSRLRFYDEDGKEISLPGGVNWVEIIDNEESLRFIDQRAQSDQDQTDLE